MGTCGTETGAYPLNDMNRVKYGSNNTAEGLLNAWLNDTMAGYYEPVL